MGSDTIVRWMQSWVERGALPGASTMIARGGRVVLHETVGWGDVESGEPLRPDAIVRIYSMTKPVTAVAALSAVADGLIGLDDPVAAYIAGFSRLSVNRRGDGERLEPRAATVVMTVRHLLTHTSGLTYGAGNPGAVSARYVRDRTDFDTDDGPLAEVVDRLAAIPLLFEPGSAWSYGVSSDVLGRVLEVATGRDLAEVVHQRVVEPLGMVDTGFQVPPAQAHRFVSLYEAVAGGGMRRIETRHDSPYLRMPETLSGGAGLVSTAADYLRFAEMVRRGGSLDGVEVVPAHLMAEMTRNQLPGDLTMMGQERFNETSMRGVGFGFGVSVVVDPQVTVWRTSPGEIAWGGYGSTAFWIDPVHELSVVFCTQLIPSDRYPLRGELRSLVMDALAAGEL